MTTSSSAPRRLAGVAALPFALVLLAMIASTAHAQGLPVAEFVSERVYVLEDSGIATAQISLTGTVWETLTVSAVTADGEGTADLDDYVGTGTFGQWNYLESGIRDVSFEVRVDSDVEPDETVYFDLQPSNNGRYVLGDITRCEVVILNDDGVLRPYFELVPPQRLNYQGTTIFLADEGEAVELRVGLSAPAPLGYSVGYTIDGGPVLSLAFAQGSTFAILAVDPPTSATPGFPFGERDIQLIDPVPGRRIGGTSSSGVFWKSDWSFEECFCCAVAAVASSLGPDSCPYPCEGILCDDPGTLGRRLAGGLTSVLPALRSYRDNVLAGTSAGQFYTVLYQDLSSVLFRDCFRNPSLFFELIDAAGEWGNGFGALAAGTGSGYVISPSMQASLVRILDELETSSEPTILEAVQRERTRLMLDDVEGLTMDQFQSRLETLGGQVPVRPTGSLSSLKVRYSAPDQ